MDDDYNWQFRTFNYPSISYTDGANCLMKFDDNTLAVIINNTTIATIKLNSLRASKNYLIPVTNTLVRNQYKPYAIKPISF